MMEFFKPLIILSAVVIPLIVWALHHDAKERDNFLDAHNCHVTDVVYLDRWHQPHFAYKCDK